MSGIAGLLHLDGRPIDPEILAQICRPLQSRSPDGTRTWQRGSAGLGHALLEIEPGAGRTQQPYARNDGVWLTSDAHLYGKSELVQTLRSAGLTVSADASEPELLLLAYRAFGEALARHLVGDFAFAIWDERRHTLLCARDHLGVRPLFYAHTAELFIFGSSINALLAHPGISKEINDTYIADFLLFGASIDREATAYKHIKRLPAAHYLAADASGIRVHRYWSPPRHQAIRYSRASEYTDHFATLFEKAVTERIPSGPLALELSGGMDSGSVAAVAVSQAKKCGQQITAYTNTCKTLMPEEQEGRFARLIADHLDIPVQFFASEDYPLFDRFGSPALRTAEPFGNPGLAQHFDRVKMMVGSGCRVLLTGQVGDTLFAGSSTYYPQLIKSGNFSRLLSDLYRHRKNAGSLSGTGLRAWLRGCMGKSLKHAPPPLAMPDWLHPEFAQRVDIEYRWRRIWQLWDTLIDSVGQLERPWFGTAFESYETPQLPLVVRHPFSDIRLVEFMLGVPNHLLVNKRMLREAMQGRLPGGILSRPKEGLPGNLVKAKMARGLLRANPSFGSAAGYVDGEKFTLSHNRFLSQLDDGHGWSSWLVISPIALAFWMNDNGLELEETR